MYRYLGNTDIALYPLINYFSSAVLLAFNLFFYKKKMSFHSRVSGLLIEKTKREKQSDKNTLATVIVCFEITLITLFQYGFAPMLNEKFGTIHGTGNNYFGTLLLGPLFVILICSIIAIDPLKQMDILTPGYALALSVVKLACFCEGCCGGIETTFGLYNHNTEKVEFPVQLVELGLCLIIFVFLLYWQKKAKKGTMFPLYIILYSGTRFFSEFLRNDKNVNGIFKYYHQFCIGAVLVGLVEYFIVSRYSDEILFAFNKVSDFIGKYLYRYEPEQKREEKTLKKSKKR